MPQFAPGEVKTAIAPIKAGPAGMSCEAELFLGPDDLTKIATSGRVPFVSAGEDQSVSVKLPVTMPSEEGSYHVYIDVFTDGMRFLAYKAIEDVVIVPLVITKVYEVGYSWYWAKHGDNYSSIHGAAEGEMCQGEGDYEGCDHDLFIGQSSYYSIYRSALHFRTSDIPIGANIIEASLKVRVADIHTGTWKLQLVDVYKWNSIDNDVYGLLGDAKRVGGEVAIDRDVDSLDYLTIVLNEFGKTLINKGDGYTTGFTKFGLRSNLEIAAQKPPAAEMVRLLPCKYPLQDRPILTVSYQP